MRPTQQLAPSQIREQVAKILKTKEFRNSKVLSDFLRYIVKETLNGNELSLKEYVIATEVLGKSSDFNPQLDAVVRIHARRLRKFLENYYLDHGKDDPIEISMPKGRYIPHFNIMGDSMPRDFHGVNALPEVHEDKLPSISVLPFKCLNPNARSNVVCSVLARELSIELSHFNELKVISDHSAEIAQASMDNWDDVVRHLGVDYMLDGTCLMQNHALKVGVELHQISDKQIIWADSMMINDFNDDQISDISEIIRKVVARICGFLGIIYRKELNNHIPKEFNTLYAVYWYKKFHQNFSIEAFEECMQATDKALVSNPKDALLNALKAELLLNLCAMDMEGDTDCFRMGSEYAQKAVTYNLNEQHAWQVLSWAKILGEDKPGFIRAAEKCIAINPNNPLYTGTLGFGYQCVYEYEKGLELMLSSIELNPYYHWVVNIGLTMYYIHKKEYNEALYWAELIKRPGLLWDPLYQICLLGHLDRKEEAKGHIDHLLSLSPNFMERAEYIVGRFTCDEELQNTILSGLEKAGLKIQMKS